ncbi:thiopeptide maturation pyridine synthase [Dactylosporangium sp. NPDC049742]|uniref:thiopeptide maturation pyridine synthase n=1 Tax=Dactylosporangium sp. NPDC049742 TaxID=3154737 RepID=UPI003414DF17
MTGWHSVHIHYHDDPRDLLLDAVRPLFAQLAPHAGAYFTPHWRQGPHLRLHLHAPADVFRDVVSPLVHDHIGGYLRDHPSPTVLDPATVLDSHRRLAELEQDPGPLLPWPANNTILEARYDRRLHMLGSVPAADLLADFHLRTTGLAFDVLQLRRQGRQLPAVAFDLLIATAEALCGADLSWSFVSFRSHAEAFLSTWPEGAGLRSAWDGYFAANADRLTARAEAVAAAVHRDGDALAQRWVRAVAPFRDRAGALVDAGMIALDPPPEARAEHAALSAQLGQASAFHAATADSPEFEAHVRDTVWFAQHRLMLNYLYLFLTRVGLTPSERFLLCHVAANAAERLHGVSAVDTARRSPTGASMGRLVPGLRPPSGGPAELSERLALRLGVHGVTREDGRHHLVSWPRAEPLGVLDDGQRAVLWRLSAGGCDPSVLPEIAADHGSPAPVDGLVDRLRERGWLAVTVLSGGVAQYTVVPKGNWWPVPPVQPSGPPTLSRFAVLRRDHNGLQLTSPRSPVVIRIHAPQVAALLAGPLNAAGAGAAGDALPARLVADLARAGLLAGDTERFAEAQWSPHELWFHDSSRQSYERAGSTRFSHFGATLWAKDRFPPPPGRPAPQGTRTVALPRPDLTRLHDSDPTLTAVLEGRRSIRVYDESSPITVDQLGELLFRCARVRATDDSQGWDTSDRPYPAGGAIHELELYLVVRAAAGLEPGMYHYDAYEHQLETLDATEAPRRRLLQAAARAMGADQPPQVLIVIAARFGRLMWKYESMALALTLKHVGVLTSTLYSVATAMRLAPCAVEAGDTDAFAQATGHDRLVESSVGEFCLGSAPSSPSSLSSEEAPCT